ncbi:MAG: hypothetical protein DRH26_04320 [Deltaproteobacteria bacterium]|nr:MAG: hypothetical protein DRH26_04320 [Deltaproteobacteria bacterium]
MLKKGNNQEQEKGGRVINRYFRVLLTDDLDDELGGPSRWSEQDKKRVYEAVWMTSYAKDFQKNLKQHIKNHLPELVIPQIIDGFKKKITIPEADNQNCVVWGLQTINAEMNSSKEKYEAECRNLEEIEQKLDEQRKKSAQMLLELFNRIAEAMKETTESSEIRIKVHEDLKEFHEKYENIALNIEDLRVLYTWMDILTKTAGNFFEEIAQALDSGRPIEGKIFDSLPSRERASLGPVCHELTYLEYHKKQGKHIETRDDNEKKKLRQLNEALNKHANSLAVATSKVIKKAAEQEKERIYNAINKVSKTHLAESWKEAQKIVPKLGFSIPPIMELDIAESDLNFDYKFEAGFDLKTITRKDKVRTKKVWAGKKRLWYTLFFSKEDVYKDEAVYEQRAYDLADIPDVEVLLTDWISQLFFNETKVVKKFTEWLTDQINKLNDMVEKAQQELVVNYKKKLDDAHDNAKRGHEVEIKRLSAILKNANHLENIFNNLPNLKDLS